MSERYNFIDFLRFIGISLIILAHCNPPTTIAQLRCFDVPLMLFVSGLSYGNRKFLKFGVNFYIKRIKRLIFPVYIFLTGYFVLFYVLGHSLSQNVIINSYLLTNAGGIGYVWIIKVFLLIMLVTPFLVKINSRINLCCFFSLLICLFFVNESLVLFTNKLSIHSVFQTIINEYIVEIIAYSILFLLGLRFRELNAQSEKFMFYSIIIISIIFFIIYIGLNGVPSKIISMYKYPPHLNYIVYGILTSTLLWHFRAKMEKFSTKRWLLFIGQNTIWIYLWHILFLSLPISNFLIKYIIVYLLSVITFYAQYRIVVFFKEKCNNSSFLNYFIG